MNNYRINESRGFFYVTLAGKKIGGMYQNLGDAQNFVDQHQRMTAWNRSQISKQLENK